MPAVSASRIARPRRSSSSPVRNRSRRLSLNLSIPRAGLCLPEQCPRGLRRRTCCRLRQAPDCPERALGERGMQPADLESGHLFGLGCADGGLHDAIQNVPVELLRRPGLALDSDVVRHECNPCVRYEMSPMSRAAHQIVKLVSADRNVPKRRRGTARVHFCRAYSMNSHRNVFMRANPRPMMKSRPAWISAHSHCGAIGPYRLPRSLPRPPCDRNSQSASAGAPSYADLPALSPQRAADRLTVEILCEEAIARDLATLPKTFPLTE